MSRPLSELLVRSGDAATPVAFGAEGSRTLADLAADATALARRLGGRRDARWLVDSEDGYRVAVTVIAAGIAGARAALPPNLQPGTIGGLAADCAVVLSSERRGSVAGTEVVDPLEPARCEVRDGGGGVASLDRDAPLVELFTSGTSGAGKRVIKSLRHLEDEVVTLERELAAPAALDPASPVLATASPRHLYGLLFRVLWPLAYGRPFLRTSLLLPDELLQQAAATGRRVALVSTPAHLRHLVACPRLPAAAASIAAVFSSGGPLEEATARALEAVLGQAPIEIFGSTETGGVAYRRTCSAQPQPPWQTMPAVRVHLDSKSQLVVESPFVTAPEGEDVTACTFTMGDRAELVAGGFRLAGRTDRVAKIGEKTFSLPALEEDLRQHPWVESAAAATYGDKTGLRIGALVVLSRQGRLALAQNGRRLAQGELAEHLARTWDRLALPRRWRFAERLPFDERGKLAAAAVQAELTAAAPQVLAPVVLSEKRDETALERELVVPRDLAFLEGHYEAFPLVQGVVQIEWAMRALADLLGSMPAVARMEAVKFKDVLRPAQTFTLRLVLDAASARADFTLADGARTFSSGRVVLAAAAEARV
ncbi:MAG TPA: AMP-binding protein [Candidatus Limnocylindrales bacterium]|nr:AMP-binding protein [Candidatus Limnocylindrales bacterium]